MNRASLVLIPFLFISSAIAAPTNPLLGKWNWNDDCKRPAYIFEDHKVTYNTGTDGNLLQYVYNNVKYHVSKKSVEVDFNKPHGLGTVKNDSKMAFQLIGKDKAQMDRKKIKAAALVRCK